MWGKSRYERVSNRRGSNPAACVFGDRPVLTRTQGGQPSYAYPVTIPWAATAPGPGSIARLNVLLGQGRHQASRTSRMRIVEAHLSPAREAPGNGQRSDHGFCFVK